LNSKFKTPLLLFLSLFLFILFKEGSELASRSLRYNRGCTCESVLFQSALLLSYMSVMLTSLLFLKVLSVLQYDTILDCVPILETISALESQQSRTNDFRIRVRRLSGKVSSISLSSISANLAERLSTIDVVIDVLVIDVLVTKMS
jgi:hypothetical protein